MEKTADIYYSRLAGTLVAGIYVIFCIRHPNFSHIIDNFDLIIHEAGHTILSFFGEFIHTLGGSFMQIFVPAVFSYYFMKQGQFFSSSFLLIWVGYNIVNVSIYMSDSIAMALPLLGGDNAIHDWNWLLTDMNLLPYTYPLSHAVYGLGMVIVVIALALCVTFSFKKINI